MGTRQQGAMEGREGRERNCRQATGKRVPAMRVALKGTFPREARFPSGVIRKEAEKILKGVFALILAESATGGGIGGGGLVGPLTKILFHRCKCDLIRKHDRGLCTRWAHDWGRARLGEVRKGRRRTEKLWRRVQSLLGKRPLTLQFQLRRES